MAWTEIETQTLTTTAASVVFSTGLSGYKFFRLTVYIVNDASDKNILLRFNNDSGGNYSYQRISAGSTTVDGARSTGATFINLTSATLVASQDLSCSILVAKPSASVKAQAIAQVGYQGSGDVIRLVLDGGEWDNTSDALTRIDIIASANNFAAGTSLMLEGLAL